MTHLLSFPNKSSTSIYYTELAFPCKRVTEVIKSFDFMNLRKSLVTSYFCRIFVNKKKRVGLALGLGRLELLDQAYLHNVFK